MKKLFLLGGGVILTSTVMFFTACKKNDLKTEKIENAVNAPSISQLQDKFGFVSIDTTNLVDNVPLRTNKNLDSLSNSQNTIKELDLANVVKVNWGKYEQVSYLIPFKSNSNKSLIVSFDVNDTNNPIDFTGAVIVENKVDTITGDGFMIYTDINGTIIHDIDNGNFKSEKAAQVTKQPLTYNKAFRRCFDWVYNDFCDGPIGCAAWYATPAPALLAVAYCTIKADSYKTY
jgi:hypothetical protein